MPAGPKEKGTQPEVGLMVAVLVAVDVDVVVVGVGVVYA